MELINFLYEVLETTQLICPLSRKLCTEDAKKIPQNKSMIIR